MANRFVLAWMATVFLLAGNSAPAANKLDSLPRPTGYVNDFAHALSTEDIEQLDGFCGQVERKLGVQFALVTIDTLDGEPIEQFTLDLARKWGVGTAHDHEGVLLLLAIKDRQSRVEVGARVEQYVTDGFAGSTLRAMRPDLRAEQYGPALLQGARQMATQIAAGKGISFDVGDGLAPETRERPAHERRSPFPKVIIGLFVFFFLLNLFRRGGGGGYRGGGGGFPIGFLLGSLLGSGGGRSRDWGGGGFGGGDSGGGGGFGGFGGGDFGGGGASSNW